MSQVQVESALFWGVSGLIIFGALSNLFFWFWLRERVYRLYAFYLTALFLLTQSTIFGSGITRIKGHKTISDEDLLKIMLWTFRISEMRFKYPAKLTIC